jgi:AraC-like DNA-binding protein
MTPRLNRQTHALRMTYPAFVFRTLVQEGHPANRLLANTGLTPESLADPEFRTGLQPLRRLFLNAMEQAGDPFLAIRLARHFEPGFIGLPAYAAMNAPTFELALEVLNRFFVLAFPAIDFIAPDHEAEPPPGEFAIRLEPRVPLGDVSPFASLSALVACDQLCKAILRTPRATLRGEMSVVRPEAWATLEGQVGFPIRCGAAGIRLYLPAQLLNTRLPAADPLNHPQLLALCEDALRETQPPATTKDEVMSFLERRAKSAPTMAHVARALGYSERGLRRSLERSGTTFRALTNEMRHQRARDMLATTTRPIKSIADERGFDTPSNFSRSFKRSTGTSPSTFRRRAQHAPPAVREE